MGRTREEPVEDLAQLELGVRVDQRGEMLRDFQTERSMDEKVVMPLTNRYYLADAKFLVALGGPKELLDVIEKALMAPKWPLYLGRRSCPPDMPVVLGLKSEYSDVRDALAKEPWIAADWYRRRHKSMNLEVACDARDGEACESQADYPLGFSQEGRHYACRPVYRYRIANPSLVPGEEPASTNARRGKPIRNEDYQLVHDPMGFF